MLLCQESHITWCLHILFITAFVSDDTTCHFSTMLLNFIPLQRKCRNVISYALKVKITLPKNIPFLQCHDVC